MAERALKNGDKVVATLRTPSALASLSSEYPPSALLVLQLDVTVSQDIISAFASAHEHFGRVDVVFNNAGYGLLGEVEGTPEDAARALFDANFWGAANVSKEAVRVFREMNKPSGGRLLQNTSFLGVKGGVIRGFYAASKFALEGLSETLAAELDPEWNIKITLIEPGWFQTEGISSNAVRLPLHPAYDKPDLLVAKVHKLLKNSIPGGGDPAKAAEVIYRIAELPDPPMHFPLGKDSVQGVRKKGQEMVAEADLYGAWSEGLEFP